MKTFLVGIGAAAILAGSALAVSANVDVVNMTCADFSGLAEADEMIASADLLAWITDAKNSAAAGVLVGKYTTNATNGQKWRPEEMHIEIEGHCIDADPAMTVIKRLQTHS